jgi:hypothetical protein
MPRFKIINDLSEITLNDKWIQATKFNSKGKLVDEKGCEVGSDYKGRQYELIEKKERAFSEVERLGRGLLGTIAVICTLFLGLFSKSVRKLFTKSTESIRFAVLKPTANLQKILPFTEKDANKIEGSIKKFKSEALDGFSNPRRQESILDFTLTKEQQKSLLDANSKKYYSQPIQGVKIIRGGLNFVIFLDSIPGFVFKPMKDKIAGKSYIDDAEIASRVISDNHLHLLYVPQSKLVEINGEHFVMQEKADLISGDYDGIKGVYLRCWHDKEMNGYIKTIFSQMVEFISKTGFSDVKYDNIPLAMNGRVALIDLDRASVITGLTGGTAKNHGLFNYIPYEYLDEFLSISKEKLERNKYQSLLKEFDVIKNRSKEKVNKKEGYSQFCLKNAISLPSQSINPNIVKIFNDNKKQDFALSIVTSLNENLSKSENFSIQLGRKVRLSIDMADDLFKRAVQIWGNQLACFSVNRTDVNFQTIVPEVLEGLKSSGYIYKYEISPYYSYVTVVC